MVVVCLAATMLFNPELLAKVRGDGLAALGYASNWWMIFHDVSYFDSFGLPSPLAHLWTLAIEEQFYLAWPLVLLALLAIVRRRTAILAIVGVAILASVVLMATTYSAVDPNRSYMGTDTRMGELLLGAFLALALHPAGDGRAHPVGRVTAVLEGRRAWLALTCSTGAFVLLAASLPDDSAFAYRGGILLAALASAGMIFVAAGARDCHASPSASTAGPWVRSAAAPTRSTSGTTRCSSPSRPRRPSASSPSAAAWPSCW